MHAMYLVSRITPYACCLAVELYAYNLAIEHARYISNQMTSYLAIKMNMGTLFCNII